MQLTLRSDTAGRWRKLAASEARPSRANYRWRGAEPRMPCVGLSPTDALCLAQPAPGKMPPKTIWTIDRRERLPGVLAMKIPRFNSNRIIVDSGSRGVNEQSYVT